MRTTHPLRRHRTGALAALAAGLVLLAGCTTDDDPAADAPPEDPTVDADPDVVVPDPDTEAPPLDGLPSPDDLDELITDGTFRGEGVVISAPAGWRFEPAAYAQGLILAVAADGRQQVAAQAVDLDRLAEPLTYDEVVEANRDGFPTSASQDEDIRIEGASQARLLRFDDLPDPEGAGPDSTLVVLVADDGQGRLAVFNYLAPSEEYDAAVTELLLASVGFDPDSDPTPPLFGTG